MSRYICPDCKKPYTPSMQNTFPTHGKRWTGTGWGWCNSANKEIPEDAKKYEPRPVKRRT